MQSSTLVLSFLHILSEVAGRVGFRFQIFQVLSYPKEKGRVSLSISYFQVLFFMRFIIFTEFQHLFKLFHPRIVEQSKVVNLKFRIFLIKGHFNRNKFTFACFRRWTRRSFFVIFITVFSFVFLLDTFFKKLWIRRFFLKNPFSLVSSFVDFLPERREERVDVALIFEIFKDVGSSMIMADRFEVCEFSFCEIFRKNEWYFLS